MARRRGMGTRQEHRCQAARRVTAIPEMANRKDDQPRGDQSCNGWSHSGLKAGRVAAHGKGEWLAKLVEATGIGAWHG
jgi:hypothetical protein